MNIYRDFTVPIIKNLRYTVVAKRKGYFECRWYGGAVWSRIDRLREKGGIVPMCGMRVGGVEFL